MAENIIEYSVNDMKTLAPHLKTMGAYVQAPTPAIVGLSPRQVIGSQDGKSLYPTIEALLNIGYDTLRGRIYDQAIVRNILDLITRTHNLRKQGQNLIDTAVNNFKGAMKNITTDYCNREKVDKKNDMIKLNSQFYGNCFKNIVAFDDDLEKIFSPSTDEEYWLLKSNLYPILEAINWMHVRNKGYSSIVVDFVFFNEKFDEKYKPQSFYVLEEINSTHTKLVKYNLEEFRKNISDKYLLNPYGTYFDRHDDNKSFEVDLIFDGMKDRAYVKNQFLIIDAIVENWSKLDQRLQSAFVLKNEKIDSAIAKEVIELVGAADDKTKQWQYNNLMTIVFDTVGDMSKIILDLELSSRQKVSKSNGIKVTLNSGYGIFGMATWAYGNNLIANSITSGGKIYGIKLFQQIASNKLNYEKSLIGA